MTEDAPKPTEQRADFRTRAAHKLLRLKLAVAKKLGGTAAMRQLHQGYWKTAGSDSYYERVGVRFDEWYMGPHQPIILEVVNLAQQHHFDQVVEIGCGDGQVLHDLSTRLTGPTRFTGLDINPEIIAKNNDNFADHDKLNFEAGDFTQQHLDHAAPNTLYFSYGGVLEYFPEADILLILDGVKKSGCAFGLVEPLDPAHDLDEQKTSYPFGFETSFSHNHKALFEKAGWVVRFDREVTVAGIRFKMMLAVTPDLAD